MREGVSEHRQTSIARGAQTGRDSDHQSAWTRALLDRHGVQIRILGRRDLLPPDVQESCARAEALTANNTRYERRPWLTIVFDRVAKSLGCRGILNFCCPYTSQEEIATAIKRSVSASVSPSFVLLPHACPDPC